jgi:hypothetical protein
LRRPLAQSWGLLKGQADRIERLQHRVVQFPSDAAAIMKQIAQSLFGCREGFSEAASALFTQQARNSLSYIGVNSLRAGCRLQHRLAGGFPKPVENLELLPILHEPVYPFHLLPEYVFGFFPARTFQLENTLLVRDCYPFRHLAEPPGDERPSVDACLPHR